MGKETVSTCRESSASGSPVNSLPSATPIAMATKIQIGRNRSSVDSRWLTDAVDGNVLD